MTDSLKFGPEWLRNLSSEGSTAGGPKYQLAEHRYGREEMLSLFDSAVRAPEQLKNLQGLYIEKSQAPMAFCTVSEEEARQWHRGINSDAVLRLSGKATLGPPSAVRGRGVSVDRGRGRTRNTSGYHYGRGMSYEEMPEGGGTGGGKLDGIPERSFSRNIRTFDRTQVSGDRWTERNGDPGDWNGSTSPRKELVGRGNADNWRRHRGSGEEDDGWRRTWARSNSWRDESDNGEAPTKPSSRSSNWGRGWNEEGLRGRTQEEVPEWATENPSESGGSFDATGAFHGGTYSDEENDPGETVGDQKEHKTRLPPEDTKQRTKSPTNNNNSNNNNRSRSEEDDRDVFKDNNTKHTSKQEDKINLTKSHSASSFKNNDSDFDRIRARHQNFVRSKTKEECGSGTGDPTSGGVEGGVVCDNNKEHVNNLNNVSNISRSRTVPAAMNIIKSDLESKQKTHTSTPPPGQLQAVPLDIRDKTVQNNTGIQKMAVVVKQQQQQVNRQRSENDIDRMAEVYKILEDEEKQTADSDRWFYTDPQGIVQGPFPSSEMLEWFMNGYFQQSLLLRRDCDDGYINLGDLIKLCGGQVPFLPNVQIPHFTPPNVLDTDQQQQQQSQPPPPPPPHLLQAQPDLLMQYHQYQLLQKQLLLNQQQSVIDKLPDSDKWNSLAPNEHLLMQQMALKQQQLDPLSQLAHVNKPPASVGLNPVTQLLSQFQQTKMPPQETRVEDSVRQLIQQLSVNKQVAAAAAAVAGGGGGSGVVPQTTMMPPQPQPILLPIPQLAQSVHLNNFLANASLSQADNKASEQIQHVLRQLSTTLPVPPASQQQQQQQPSAPPPQQQQQQQQQSELLWGARPGGAWNEPPQQKLPKSLWDMKTEPQILAEQQLLLAEEEAREKKKKEELLLLKQKAKEEEEERLRLLEEQRLKEELHRREEERLKREREEKKKAEELRKKQEEAQRKKEEKERRKEEEREKKRLQAEEEKRLEQQRIMQEEAARLKQQEEEEMARKQERQRRQEEALRHLQEQQLKPKTAPWSPPPAPANITSAASLAEIQKLQEREKKQQQMIREQQQMLLQIAQQNEIQMREQREQDSKSNGLKLNWAEQQPKLPAHVKSLAEIQAEEQLQLAKQLEKDRLERVHQQREVASLAPSVGVWGTASQSLSWASNAPWGAPTPSATATVVMSSQQQQQQQQQQGFWDGHVPSVTKTKQTKQQPQPASPVKNKNPITNSLSNTNVNSKLNKTKSKKEEAAVMKLFEPQGDDFTTWCTKALQTMQAGVDIPTFVGFLREIESPYEVKDYVKLYLGEVKEAQEFARQFLERRSRWKSLQKNAVEEDDMSAPAQAVNPTNPALQLDFQEVKGKGKKSKKGKMLKMDSRCLGFSVTAAPDRINIGDRDYIDSNM